MSSKPEDVSKKIGQLSLQSEPKKEKKQLNILLLGETGVGKSTFINALANYITYSDLSRAENEQLLVLIPSMITVTDKSNDNHTINIGEKHANETVEAGQSATQDVKTYVFPFPAKNLEIRLIDTPGMGDTRGIEQDKANCENILSYIAKLHHLHAICFLFKSTQTRSTALFQYCISQILSRLDKSASNNIIFVFTNTRASDYSTGETMPLIIQTVKEIEKNPPHVSIPYENNKFCFENEAFRYLAALKNKVEFSDHQKKRFRQSWKKSIEQCNLMIDYIDKLVPHYVKHTNAINEVRRAVLQLAQPLADVTQLINLNMNILERHKEEITRENQTVEGLKSKLYMPTVELDLEKLNEPVTVCTKTGCAEIHKVGGENVHHYVQRCHNPCYLNNVPNEIIGAPEIFNCACIDRSTGHCTQCKCSFRLHMHVYYLTRLKEGKKKDVNVLKTINSKEKVVESVLKLIKDMQKRQQELDDEYQVIVSCSARFAHFLQNNAITPINDYYKEYITYLIDRERLMGTACNMQTIRSLERLLQQYEMEKAVFERALKSGQSKDLLTPEIIQKSIQDLYKLKHNGSKIKELFDCQKNARKNEHKQTEYVHKQSVNLTANNAEKKPVKGKNDDKKDDKKVGNAGKNSQNQQQKERLSNKHKPSPPPSYQESIRPFRQGNSNPHYSGYPPHGYPPQPGPSGHPNYPHYYPPGPYPAPGQQPYPGPGPNAAQEAKGDRPVINVTITPSQAQNSPHSDQYYPNHPQTPPQMHAPYPYPPYPPYGAPYGPHPSYGAHPAYPQGAPHAPPFGYSGPYPPPGPSQSYNYHHGVNRNVHNQNQQKNYRDGKGFRGGKGRGGISRKRRNKNADKNKEKKDNDSSDSDSGSSKN